MSKILIIEDDKNNRDIYSQVLKEAGYEVDVAEDGEMGMFKLNQGGYSLILLDLMLPKVDGLTILSNIKKSPPKLPNGKIVVLSNLSHEPIIQQAKALGAFEALTKSDIDPEQLVEEVKKVLSS